MSANIEPMSMCSSWETFEAKVMGSATEPYIVAHERLQDGSDYIYGFTCTCPAFKYREGDCKHIDAVRERACLWHQQMDGGESSNGTCPKCGDSVIGIMCAV